MIHTIAPMPTIRSFLFYNFNLVQNLNPIIIITKPKNSGIPQMVMNVDHAIRMMQVKTLPGVMMAIRDCLPSFVGIVFLEHQFVACPKRTSS